MWGHAHDEYASRRPQSTKEKKPPLKKRTTSKAKLNTNVKSSSVEEKSDDAGKFKFRGQRNASNVKRAPVYSWNHAHDVYAAPKKANKNKASAVVVTCSSPRRKSNSDLGKTSKNRQQRSQTEFTVGVGEDEDEDGEEDDKDTDNEAQSDDENDADNVNGGKHSNTLSVDNDALSRSKSDGTTKKAVKRKSQPNIAKPRFISASNMHDRYEGSSSVQYGGSSNRHVRTKSAQGHSRSAKKAVLEKSKKRKKKRRSDEDDDDDDEDDDDDAKKKPKKHKPKPKKHKDKDKGKEKKKKKKKDDDKKKKKKKRHKYDSDDSDEKENDKSKNKKSKLSAQEQEFRARLEADIISDKPDVCFKDVQGLANVKLALYETVVLPALRPELFTGLRSPTGGLLLFGPPGNGKTMIAKCVAAECECTFFSISASSITSKWVGDSERIMRNLFELAAEKAPSIIFIDEIDSLLTARGGKNEAESSRRIKTEFMVKFGGLNKDDASHRILVIGATNLPDQLDDAVLRRFEKRIMVPLPDGDTRSGLLRFLMSKQKTDISSEEYDEIVVKTDGYSCSDIAILCKDAAMGPIRSLGAKILELKNQSDMPPIKLMHFDEALGNVRPSLTAESLTFFDEWNESHGSKIHLSMNALPENMKPYTQEELDEIVRKREEALQPKETSSNEDDESDSNSEDDSDEDSSQESSD